MDWFNRTKKFLGEVRMELRRTTWPSKTEVQNTTLVVLVTVFVFAAFLGVVDLALGSALKRILEFFSN